MLKKITTCLLFDGHAEEAARFYTSLFEDSRIVSTNPHATVFVLEGQPFLAINGPESEFTWAMSLAVTCKTQEELDRTWENLLEGGEELACGWLKDRFGVSWQVMPDFIPEMLNDPDPKKVQRVMQAVTGMTKLDFAVLTQVYNEPENRSAKARR